MNTPNEFDDLARRKLNEREHPFDEAAWNALRPELDAIRGEKRRRRFLLWFLLLAVTGTAGWLLWNGETTSTIAEKTIPHLSEDHQEPVDGTLAKATTIPSTSEANPDDVPAPASPRLEESPVPEEQPRSAEQGGSSRLQRTSPKEGPRAMSTGTPLSAVDTANKTDASITSLVLTDENDHGLIGAMANTTRSGQSDTTTSATSTAEHVDHTEHAIDPEEVVQSTAGSTEVQLTDSTTHGVLSTSDTLQYVFVPDSMNALDPTITILPTEPRSKLELTLWGGPFSTSTNYRGERSTDWASTIGKAGSVAFGAELMRQGEHFGIGAGLHYSTYVEQLNAEGLKDELRTTVTTYELNGIDTTVMVVNGTVWINGQQYYMTQMLDTTIYVLVGTDSEVISNNVRRNALARSNRTSYLEIPLLFETHTRYGRWGFAVRGGPTLGIVQGRRGVLPTTSGYTDLDDEAFSELVLGYTVQGHVRYHLGVAWSVGIGPAIRGQLMNTLQSDQLQRRSHAIGAVIAIGYRLP